MIERLSLNRRAVLRRSLAVAALPVWGRLAAAGVAVGDSKQLLTRLSALVIPDTGTPGAVVAGVPDFVVLALDHGLDGGPAGGAVSGIRLLDAVQAELDHRAGGSYLAQPPERQESLLAALDADCFAPGAASTPWRTLKGLILTGYYTSEIGASKELRYELVPGRFDPDLPKTPSDRSWSSDWTALDFG